MLNNKSSDASSAKRTVGSQQRACYTAKTVTFKSRGRSGRKWQVKFDLGSDEANSLKALDYMWKNNAAILAV